MHNKYSPLRDEIHHGCETRANFRAQNNIARLYAVQLSAPNSIFELMSGMRAGVERVESWPSRGRQTEYRSKGGRDILVRHGEKGWERASEWADGRERERCWEGKNQS